MKNFILFFILLFCSISFAQDGGSVLKRALRSSQEMSFSASMHNPFSVKKSEKDILPYGPYWKFYRLYQGDVLYLRLDISTKDKLIETYLKNKDGTYGLAADGFAARIIEIPMLWYPELTHLNISDEEMKLSSYSIYKTLYNHRTCYKVIMRTPQDTKSLMKIIGDSKEEFQINKDRYLSKRVFVREFFIDQRNFFIYSRQHFNRNGKLIFKVELGDVVFEPSLKLDLFKTPKKVRGQFIERNFFASRALEKMTKDQRLSFVDSMGNWIKSIGNSIWNNIDMIAKWFSPILAMIGIACIIIVIVIKRKNNGM